MPRCGIARREPERLAAAVRNGLLLNDDLPQLGIVVGQANRLASSKIDDRLARSRVCRRTAGWIVYHDVREFPAVRHVSLGDRVRAGGDHSDKGPIVGQIEHTGVARVEGEALGVTIRCRLLFDNDSTSANLNVRAFDLIVL